MFFRLILIGGLALTFLSGTAKADGAVGFRQTVLEAEGDARALHMALWYPTEEKAPVTMAGDNPIFNGESVIADAAPTGRRYPLAVLSHGYGGNWRNLNWLARQLAVAGYIVAAPDHPGTTTRDMRPATNMLSARPADISRVMDELTGNPALAGDVNPDQIVVLGHSLGGWTTLALAGAVFEPQRFLSDCRENPVLQSCQFQDVLAVAFEGLHKSAQFADRRLRAAVSLDLGLARGFSPASLSVLTIPTMVVAAGADGLSAASESGHLVEHMPANLVRHQALGDATHFSFVQRCKPEAAAILDAEQPGESIVCLDKGPRGRAAIQDQVGADIIAFLNDVLGHR